ncbi:MAG: 4a-hydroxytetrahydrobiopterin dehydratase [Burkholderiaceae bacterium]
MVRLKENEPQSSVKRLLSATEIVALLARLEGWRLNGDGTAVAIEKTYLFTDFHQTMAFVNAVAFVAHAQDHHPDLRVGYDQCTVAWRTHDIGGISRADLDCAARIDALLVACAE